MTRHKSGVAQWVCLPIEIYRGELCVLGVRAGGVATRESTEKCIGQQTCRLLKSEPMNRLEHRTCCCERVTERVFPVRNNGTGRVTICGSCKASWTRLGSVDLKNCFTSLLGLLCVYVSRVKLFQVYFEVLMKGFKVPLLTVSTIKRQNGFLRGRLGVIVTAQVQPPSRKSY